MQCLRDSNLLSSVQYPHRADGTHMGQCKYRTLPFSQKLLLDSTDLEHITAKIKSHSIILAVMYNVLTKTLKIKLNYKVHMKKKIKVLLCDITEE